MKILEEYPYLETLTRILLKKLDISKLIIIDIGAFDGMGCILLKRGFSHSTIYAIEPCPTNYKILINNVKKYKRIIPLQLAISDTNAREYLYVYNTGTKDTSSQSNSLYKTFVKSKAEKVSIIKVSVKTLTLKEFCRQQGIQHINLLKINCEGSEYKIFNDESSHFIFDNINIINLALHGKTREFLSNKYIEKKHEINKFLINKGFTMLYGIDMLHHKVKGHVSQLWVK